MAKKQASTMDAGLYALLDEVCTESQIKDLMRESKGNCDKMLGKEITLGNNKSEAIKNLRHAVSHGAISLTAVVDLLRESEEHGRQHIYFYKCKTETTRKTIRNGGSIQEMLFGEELDGRLFPEYECPKEGMNWVDFRIGTKSKPHDWFGKLYSNEQMFKLKTAEFAHNGDLVKVYTPTAARVVNLVRWNDPDILEVRVSNWEGSKKTIKHRLEAVLKMLEPAVPLSSIEEWDLSKVRTNLIKKRRENMSVYQLGSMELSDSQDGRNSFCPRTTEELADDARERSLAIDALVKGDSSCRHFAICWLNCGGSEEDRDNLRSTCGAFAPNELAITARTSSSSIDHVINQLRKFDY